MPNSSEVVDDFFAEASVFNQAKNVQETTRILRIV